mmetsp:Transcript_15219/g.45052  ORF Transcript_15219/g.45052 Transcript_15219/m.45052 type:complete len:230 (+) Transcript_15219:1958-2647(+)
MDVTAPRAYQRLVEAVLVARRQHDDATLLRRGAVERVQEPREGDAAAPPPLVRACPSLHEDCVDVLEQQHGACRRGPQQLREVVVVHLAVGQVHEADVETQLASEDLREGGLAAAWRSVQQVAPAVRNARVVVPIGGGLREEVAHVLDNVIREALVKHNGVAVAPLPRNRLCPHGHPHVLDVNVHRALAVLLQHRLQRRGQELLQDAAIRGPPHGQRDRLGVPRALATV